MKSTIQITIEIDGDPELAIDVVDDFLDAGTLQDAINDHDSDMPGGGPLHVLSALVDHGCEKS